MNTLDDSLQCAAIPLVATGAAGIRGGTGFLLRDDEGVHLVTVAHLATGVRENSDKWDEWVPQFHVVQGPQSTPGSSVSVFPQTIELFDTDALGSRTPRFRYATTDLPGRIADLVVMPLEPAWDWHSNFTVLDASFRSPATVANGGRHTATAWGYPTAEPTWPTKESPRGRFWDYPAR